MCCIIKNTNRCSIFREGSQMKEFDEILQLAAAHPEPAVFTAAVLEFAKSLQDCVQTQALAADPLAKESP